MKNPKKSTNTDLVTELEKRNTGGKYDMLISRAKDNVYHDYKANDMLFAEPKIQLLMDLQLHPELSDIINEVMEGNYDETADLQDCLKMRSEIIENSGADSALIQTLGLDSESLKNRFPEFNSDDHD